MAGVTRLYCLPIFSKSSREASPASASSLTFCWAQYRLRRAPSLAPAALMVNVSRLVSVLPWP